MIETSEIFRLAKTVNMRDYLERSYRLEFNKSNKACCPFHDEKSGSFSVKELRKGWHFECFGCGVKGDSTKFVELFDRVNALEAAKQVCRDNGIDIGEEPLSKEDQAKRDKAMAERIAQDEARRAELMKLGEAADATTLKAMEKKSEKLYEEGITHKKEIMKLFPMWNKKLDAWWNSYLGYDAHHESVAILIKDEKQVTHNIKTREKWEWIKEERRHNIGVRNPNSKWGGEYGAKIFPFPLEWYQSHEDNRVIVCEGEKDALNLLNLGIRCLTIGAAGGSIDPWVELLRDKEVLIWFDHDIAGYSGALKHHSVIKEVAREVKIVSFDHLCHPRNKYDISDYIDEYKITNAEKLFEQITYATFTCNDRLIDYFCDIYPESNLHHTLDKFKTTAKSITLDNVLHYIIEATPRVNGQADSEVDDLEAIVRELNKKDIVSNFAAFVGDGGEAMVQQLKEALKKKATLYTNYRQTHEVDVANCFIKTCKDIGYPIISYHGFLYIWIATHYYKFKESELRDFIMHRWFYAAKVDVKKQSADMVDKLIRNMEYKSYSLEPLREKQEYNVVTFKNGTFIVHENGRTLFKSVHQIEDGSTFALDFSYNPKARAPKWEKFLKRVLPIKEEREALMEFFGYCFLPSHRYQKFLLMYGQSGSNGKSIVMEVIRMFFGREMIGDLDLQDTEGHQLEALDGKLINIGSEIDANNMDGGQFGKLKKMVAGESVTVNPKQRTPYSIYGAQIPKFIYSANIRPKSGLDAGVFRRMLLLGFTEEIKGKEIILDIQKRFEDELDGIFNMALDGLGRLISNNRFTQSEMMRENIDEYKKEANPIMSYIQENIERDNGIMIPIDFLYGHYKAWCEQNGHTKRARPSFSREIREQLGIKTKKLRVFHQTLPKEPYHFFGIKLKESNIESFKIDGIEIKTKHCNYDPLLKVVVEMN